MTRLLQSLGHEVIVANPRQVKLITESSRKDDRLDAQTLARLARIDPSAAAHPAPKREGTNGIDCHSGTSSSDRGAHQFGEYSAGFGEGNGGAVAQV